jgi:predicted transposase YbfD/YdcC
MANLKHVGRLKNNKRKAIVAYRTLPGDPYSALIVFTDSLGSDDHDTLMKLVESAVGQEAYELAEAMDRTYLPDGRRMLVGFHQTGKLFKIPTKDVEMVPNVNSIIGLDELNEMIAAQSGVSIDDLSIKPADRQQKRAENAAPTATAIAPTAQATQVAEEPLTKEELARKLRGQADAMFKEARKLREVAEELVPTKKKASSAVTDE